MIYIKLLDKFLIKRKSSEKSYQNCEKNYLKDEFIKLSKSSLELQLISYVTFPCWNLCKKFY